MNMCPKWNEIILEYTTNVYKCNDHLTLDMKILRPQYLRFNTIQ